MALLLRILTRVGAVLASLIILSIGTAVFANLWVLWIGTQHIIHTENEIPRGSIALVLGTSPRTGKQLNPFFEGRMETAAALFRSGAVSHFVLSGDNRRADYNEPYAMRDALRARGIPDSAFTLDYAGFRTLDSVVRAKQVFQLQKIVIITDDFHEPRALFLASMRGIDAIGFSSSSVPWKRSYKTRIREWASRIRACEDIYIRDTQPKFLGKPIQVPTPHPTNLPVDSDEFRSSPPHETENAPGPASR